MEPQTGLGNDPRVRVTGTWVSPELLIALKSRNPFLKLLKDRALLLRRPRPLEPETTQVPKPCHRILGMWPGGAMSPLGAPLPLTALNPHCSVEQTLMSLRGPERWVSFPTHRWDPVCLTWGNLTGPIPVCPGAPS